MQPLPNDSSKKNESEEESKRSPIQHSKRSKIPGSEKRVFVEFFIPPPPPLPGDEESSDSYSDTQDEGYDITGIGKGTNILDYSEQVVKKLTTKNESRGKGPTKLTTINMESILNNTTRSGNDSIPDPQFRTGKVPAVRRLTSGSINLHSGATGAKTPVSRPLRAQSMPIPYERNLDLSASSSESDASSSSMGSTTAAVEYSTEVVIPTKESRMKKLSPIEETSPPLESLEELKEEVTRAPSPPPPSPSPPSSSSASSSAVSSTPAHPSTSAFASSPSSPTLKPSASPTAPESTPSEAHKPSSLPSSPSRSRSYSPRPDRASPLFYSPSSTPPPSETRPFSTSPQGPRRGFDERVLSPRPDEEGSGQDEEKEEDKVSYHSSRGHSPVVFALELAQAREDSSNRTSPMSPKPAGNVLEEKETEKPKEEKEKEKETEKETEKEKEKEKSLSPISTEKENGEKESSKEDLIDEIGNIVSPRQKRMNRLSLSLVNTDVEIDTPRISRVFDPLIVKHLDSIPVEILEDSGDMNEDVKGLDLDSELPLTDLDEDEKLSELTDEEHDQSKRLRRVGRFGKDSILKDVAVETWN